MQKIEAPGSRFRRPGSLAATGGAFTLDGSIRDVTRLTVFSSSDTSVADVTLGLVELSQSGEVAILCRYLEQLLPVRLSYLEPSPASSGSNPPENNLVDKNVFTKLKMLNILPSDLCSDSISSAGLTSTCAGFSATAKRPRRSWPTRRRINGHSSSTSCCSARIRRLLDAEVARRPPQQPQDDPGEGIHVYQQWLHRHIADNTPFDRIVRELLTANGNTFNNPPANYTGSPATRRTFAESTVQLFFGIRMQRQCHNHPFERWTQDDYYSMSAFFAPV